MDFQRASVNITVLEYYRMGTVNNGSVFSGSSDVSIFSGARNNLHFCQAFAEKMKMTGKKIRRNLRRPAFEKKYFSGARTISNNVYRCKLEIQKDLHSPEKMRGKKVRRN